MSHTGSEHIEFVLIALRRYALEPKHAQTVPASCVPGCGPRRCVLLPGDSSQLLRYRCARAEARAREARLFARSRWLFRGYR
jgi:hypothetical protein